MDKRTQIERFEEIQQREGESAADWVVRMAKMSRAERERQHLPVISKKSFVRKCAKLRKDVERGFGMLRKGSDPPIDTASSAYVEHMGQIAKRRQEEFEKGPMRWMASLIATGERARRDPEYRKDLEKHATYGVVPPSRMVKPHKGRDGRDSSKDVRGKAKLSVRDRAIELHRKGYTEVEIGKVIDRDPRTVRRYLTGK